MFKFLLITIVAVAYASAQNQTANYCATTLCSAGVTHIACGNTGNFASTCAADKELIDLTSWISYIVNKHNTFRNDIASGTIPPFSPAVCMATMKWDSELAKMATLNVKQCKMAHDKCRNTDRFKYSGQNLGWYWSSSTTVPPQTAIDSGLNGWYNEKQYATMAHINSYTSTSPTIGHFTPIVNDRNTHVGCALLRQSKNGGKEYFFACNYAQTNILNRKVYQSGTKAASGCTTGTNPSYPNCCSVNEPINPNTIL